MDTWLDTETKAILYNLPPSKMAPADALAYTVVILSTAGCERTRLLRAIEKIDERFRESDIPASGSPNPFVLRAGLSQADAMLAQFELISCDAISVFLRDPVVSNADEGYLEQLFDSLLSSEEFHSTTVTLGSLPKRTRGEEFVDQFIGHSIKLPLQIQATYKKARIMRHWATRIGGDVRIRRD